jgi:hypothetical protein
MSKMENVRSNIRHPALRDAFDADWYWPFELTDEHKKLAGVKRAIKEGWAEWIETEEDIEAIKSRISKQNLDKLLSLIEQEDKPNPESPSISNQVSNQNTSQLNAQLNADIGAKTMERILGETAVIDKNGVDLVDSNGNKSSTLITLEDFWAD